MAYEDVRDGSWRVRVFADVDAWRQALDAGARLPFVANDKRAPPSLVLQQSRAVRDVALLSLFAARPFKAGDFITEYYGTLDSAKSARAVNSQHVLAAFGRPGRVVVGITSARVARKNAKPCGVASLVNDFSIDVAASLRATADAGGEPRIVTSHAAAAAAADTAAMATSNTDFVALVVADEYADYEVFGDEDYLPHVRWGLVATRDLAAGEELSAAYGTAFWTTYLRNHCR